ncbi:MAG: hypothetical protein J6X85_06070, partial [Ruminococcus sp.]|nr:hypothetical protein [Ruminococcus sp.]
MREHLVNLAIHHSGIQILLMRRTFPELKENHTNKLLKLLNPLIRRKLVKYKDVSKEFIFWNESRIQLGYCKNETDVLQYQGQ